MRQYKFIGLFKNYDGHTYTAIVHCDSVLQAFFLLTADAIRSAKHYQLETITDEKGNVTKICDIKECEKLFS